MSRNNRGYAFPRGDGRHKGEKLVAKPCITDTSRIDWLDRNRSINHDSDAKEHWIVAWVAQGDTGNKNGCSGKFAARAPTFRECIDKFLSGDIVRVD